MILAGFDPEILIVAGFDTEIYDLVCITNICLILAVFDQRYDMFGRLRRGDVVLQVS